MILARRPFGERCVALGSHAALWAVSCLLLGVILFSGSTPAQEAPAQGAQSDAVAEQITTRDPAALTGLRVPVLIIDYERLFTQSRFGQRVLREIEAAGRALIDENDRIEAELSAEELVLTSQRATLQPEEFRRLADAFDEKVQTLRAAQQTKAEAVGQGRDAEERRFRQQVTPIIARLMQEAGAVVVLDQRDSIVWVEAINITDTVLRLADRVIGSGAAAPEDEGTSPPVPQTPPGGALAPGQPVPDIQAPNPAPQGDLLQAPTPTVPVPSSP